MQAMFETPISVKVFRSSETLREGAPEDTGQLFVGPTLGDFTKTGISTAFTTGATLGIGCNLVGTEVMPPYVSSFVWGSPGAFVEHRIDDMIGTAARAMERRKVELTSTLDALIRGAFEATQADRDVFLRGRR
jgi:hypothetical protein